jgi:DNA-binding response OmpR family regulator
MKVLVVEDEPSLLETIARQLTRDGHNVIGSQSAEEAIKQFRIQRPDMIVLDVMLPGRNGFEFSQSVRESSKVPILFLSARASEADRLKGFDVGGDDYLTKPFNLRELSARVRAILRRLKPEVEQKRTTLGSLTIDGETHEAEVNERKLDLKPKEFALLHFLASHPGKVFTRDALLDRVWGPDAYVTPRTVDVHVSWLRRQLSAMGTGAPRILTVRGIGYKIV